MTPLEAEAILKEYIATIKDLRPNGIVQSTNALKRTTGLIKYAHFVYGEHVVKEKILDELLDNLHAYCDKLYFNIGGEYGGQQELTITAEGKTDYFDAVEELIKEAPELEGWSFIAFMQPGDLDYV